MMNIVILILTWTVISLSVSYGQSDSVQSDPSYKEVVGAVEDYVDALYLVDSMRIERSVDSSLRKVGYWYNAEQGQYVDNLEMTYDQLTALSASWNKNGNQADSDSPRVITIFDINDKTASAKLTAAWGIDYFHLSKVGGKWKIMNVMWQTPLR